MKCNRCKDSGIWLVNNLDDKYHIEKCDNCNIFKKDIDAFTYLNKKIYCTCSSGGDLGPHHDETCEIYTPF